MTKDNRIRSPRPCIIAVGVLIALLVILVVVVMILDRIPQVSGPIQSGSAGRATSADLYCLEFSRYNGEFIEDGSHQPVTDVAAALIENRSQEFLDLATVTYDVGGRTAEFVVTGLPPGAKAWVLESNRMTISDDAQFKFLECTSAFRQDAVLSAKDLAVFSAGNTLSVTNSSDQTLENVCVYYKTVNNDGAYLGGITYMLAFDTLKPGETATRSTAHFTQNSRIVRYSYQPE